MPSVLILGAGLAGLMAARTLAARNVLVTVLDKGRGVGGRLATRRLATGRADHGAQYFSAKTPDFQRQVAEWLAAGVAREWPLEAATAGDMPSDHPRYIGVDGMNTLAKHLADGLITHTGERVVRLRTEDGGWAAETETGAIYQADAVCCTIPAPQALMLLADSELDPDSLGVSALADIRYQPNITVMAALNAPSRIPAGGVRYETGPVAWVADNQQKGISPGPSLTIQASADFSRTWLDHGYGVLNVVGKELLAELRDWLDPGSVDSFQVHRWRYSLADVRYPAPLLAAQTPAPLLFGGDGFGMGNVEGAFVSGRAMAQWLTDAGL
ncbi:MAG: FAD-dependent oxidoreductase [Bacteroidetes bacterium]|nr:FAD-dependent oxidoreductase [Fibrella sp.]